MEISYRLIPVHPVTWSDMAYGSEVLGLTSASVTKEVTDGSPLLESGMASISVPLSYDFRPGWYRLEGLLLSDTGGAPTRIPISTMWMRPTGDTLNYGRAAVDLQGTSVLQPLQDRMILKGDYVAKGSNAALKVAELIRDATPAPVSIAGSFTIDNYYVFDPGTTYLDVVWGLLKKAGWCLQIACDGRISVMPKPATPKFNLNRSTKMSLLPGIRRTYDRGSIPNRIKVIDQNGVEVLVENHQSGSHTSYEYLGRWIDLVDTAPQQKDGESTLGYAKRQLELASTFSYMYEYGRRWIDGLLLFDMVRATLPNEGVTGELRITRQQITCGKSLSVTESSGREIKEYVA